MLDWTAIKTEYVTTSTSYRKLAIKHDVSFNTLKDVAKRENWYDLKKDHTNKVAIKTLQKIEVKQVNSNISRIDKILEMSDKAIGIVDKALNQINGRRGVRIKLLRPVISAFKDLKDIILIDKETDRHDDGDNINNIVDAIKGTINEE